MSPHSDSQPPAFDSRVDGPIRYGVVRCEVVGYVVSIVSVDIMHRASCCRVYRGARVRTAHAHGIQRAVRLPIVLVRVLTRSTPRSLGLGQISRPRPRRTSRTHTPTTVPPRHINAHLPAGTQHSKPKTENVRAGPGRVSTGRTTGSSRAEFKSAGSRRCHHSLPLSWSSRWDGRYLWLGLGLGLCVELGLDLRVYWIWTRRRRRTLILTRRRL